MQKISSSAEIILSAEQLLVAHERKLLRLVHFWFSHFSLGGSVAQVTEKMNRVHWSLTDSALI